MGNYPIYWPIWNEHGIVRLEGELSKYVRHGDFFCMVSGNNSSEIDVDWQNDTAQRLAARYPYSNFVALTAGVQNLYKVAYNVRSPITYAGHIYEPAMPNNPDFRDEEWETRRFLERCTGILHGKGLKSVAMLTGGGVFPSGWVKDSWDYGRLSLEVDMMVVEIQGEMRRGRWHKAMSLLNGQMNASGSETPWVPQITLDVDSDDGLTNSVTGAVAAATLKPGPVMIWSAPADDVKFAEQLICLKDFRN